LTASSSFTLAVFYEKAATRSRTSRRFDESPPQLASDQNIFHSGGGAQRRIRVFEDGHRTLRLTNGNR